MTRFYSTIPAWHFFGEQAINGVPAGQSILLSASSFESLSRRRGKPGALPLPHFPDHIPEVAVDPGGFVAQLRYGGYRFSWDTYIAWLHAIGPKLTWAAFPDLPCEKELASDSYKVRARQEQTLAYAHALWVSPSCDKWDGFDGQPWSWVATVQGRSIDEYVWMAEQMAPLLSSQQFQYTEMARVLRSIGPLLEPEIQESVNRTEQWASMCSTSSRVAIGSLCKRTDMKEACRIVAAVADVIPNTSFHLWGIDQRLIPVMQRAGLIDRVASFDTSAYNGRFGSDIPIIDAERKRLGLSQGKHANGVLLPRYAKRIAGRLAQTTLDFTGRNVN